MKNIFIKLFIVIFIFLTLYFSRQIFSYKYEPEYYENWYYHSQWNIPNSVRGIGDGDLYKFVGYRLASGENPFNINYEVPPFAKLLYGLTEKYLANPYLVSLFFYFFSFIVLYYISKHFFNNKNKILLVLLLFASSPFISTQVKETMLDLPLMFFFLVHLFYFLEYLKNKKFKQLIWAGFFLGIATGCKIGIYTPLIFLIDLFFILGDKHQKIKKILIYSLTILSGYCFSFISYFVKHPNPIPWLKLHQKPINFYLGQAASRIDHLNQIRGMLLNRYQGFWKGAQVGTLGDWSPMLSAGLIILIIETIISIKKKNKSLLYLSLFSLSFIAINSFLPFFPRYLMPIIPTFCILIVIFFQQKKLLIYLLILLNIPFFYSSVIVQPYQGTIESTTRFIDTRNYRELYRAIKQEQRNNLNEDFFIASYENFLNQIGTRKIESKITNIEKYKNKITGILEVNYQTRYGQKNNISQIEFNKINNQWKLTWNWNYLYLNYDPSYPIIIEEKPNAEVVIEAFMVPRLMFDWGLNLSQIQSFIGIDQKIINERIRFCVPDKYYRWVGDVAISKFDKNHKIPGLEYYKFPNLAKIYFKNRNQEEIIIFE
jgi:hypothetical protein